MGGEGGADFTNKRSQATKDGLKTSSKEVRGRVTDCEKNNIHCFPFLFLKRLSITQQTTKAFRKTNTMAWNAAAAYLVIFFPFFLSLHLF